MLIIRGGINSKKRELCPTALALSAFYYNKNKHADTYIMYLHAYSTRHARKFAHCLQLIGHLLWIVKTWQRHRIKCQTRRGRNARILLQGCFTPGCIRNLYPPPCIYSAVILLPHKDCFPPSGAPGAEYSGNAP